MLRALTVVKVGGRVLDDPRWVATFAATVTTRGRVVLVHGGGKEVSGLQARLGMVPRWREGLRVTDDETLAVATMVLSGVVNKRLVAALIRAGVRAVGVSGEDDGMLTAEPVLGGALGRTGSIVSVRPSVLRLLLGAGITPVVSPLSRGPGGSALNVNADDAAVALAGALGASRLLFLSDVTGVRLSGTVADEVAAESVEAAIASGAVTDGMAPKLRAAARAAAQVPDVRIGALSLLSGGPGTRVRHAVAGVSS